MATLTVNPIGKAGVDITDLLAAATEAGDEAPFTADLILVYHSEHSEEITVTIAKPAATVDVKNYGALGLDDLTVVLPVGSVTPQIRAIRVPQGYAPGGVVEMTYSLVTDLKVAAFKIAHE